MTTGKLNANAREENGQYPFFTCDAEPYRINAYAYDTTAILISGNGSQVGHINYYSGKFNAYQRTYILDNFQNIYDKYLLCYLEAHLKNHIDKNSKKGSVPYITAPMLNDFMVVVPTIEKQNQIVNALDSLKKMTTDLTEGLPAEINARRKQYEYYRDKLLTFKELEN